VDLQKRHSRIPRRGCVRYFELALADARCFFELDGGFMAKVTGIGGVFFKSTNDHKKLADWYKQHLGIQLEPWGGAILKWTDDNAEDGGLTVWHVAEKNTEWFSPSRSSFMINYRIDNMADMLAQLQRNGVDIFKGPESDDNGTFAWILDPDGNKIELWEPRSANKAK
jgi:predicted enzyme related to lactoylglutathione lyase